jgi:protein required for attachment to host cells
MSKLKINAGDWVVVCDGRKALILANQGDDKFPNLRRHEVHEHEDDKTSAQGTDSPGRVQPSVGTARSSVEQTDWHDQAERQFLEQLAARLDAAIAKGETRSLVVVAAPRALGMLRQSYTAAVKDAVQGEIHKDYVRMPVHEIEANVLRLFES